MCLILRARGTFAKQTQRTDPAPEWTWRTSQEQILEQKHRWRSWWLEQHRAAADGLVGSAGRTEQPTPLPVSLRGGRRVHDPAAWGTEMRDSYPQTGNEGLLQGG